MTTSLMDSFGLHPRLGVNHFTLLLFVAGFAIRTALSFTGGIWADEALMINILAIPTLTEMVDFLRHHESHPPLFYILLRGWQRLAGNSDAAMLGFVSAIGAMIVPATFVVGRRLFSEPVGLFAAALAAFSPSLVEHSAQIRPYGVLPLLVLASCYFLITGLQRGGLARWACYAISTALLLYTHNWTWLVFGAEILAAGLTLILRRGEMGLRRSFEFTMALLGVGILYAPWMSSLVLQAVQAGHTAPPLNGLVDRIAFVVFGVASIPYLLLLGTYPTRKLELVLVATAAVLVIVAVLRLSRPLFLHPTRRIPPARSGTTYPDALRMLLLIPAAALGAAFIMSPRSNLIFERCIVMLAPPVLLGIAYGVDRVAGRQLRDVPSGWLAIGSAVFLLTLSLASDVALLMTSRSNARDAARSVARAIRPNDLVVVAPEWHAPAFNHYFPPLVEQMDYPHPRRSGLLDFADVRSRVLDTAATIRLRRSIEQARLTGRRVWLVTDRRYLRYIDEELPRLTTEQQRNRYTSVLYVKDARDALVDAFGSPDSTTVAKGRTARYEELVALLFASR